MEFMLYAAAALTVAVGIAHSYLGERYLLMRLLRSGQLAGVFSRPEFAARTLRFAWHVTSIAWFGFAAILFLLARPPVTPEALGIVIGGTFLVHFAVALAGSRGKHLSWPLFLAIGLAAIYATRM
ncbi:hypothetical protein [Piscinibacter sp.]|uniref:hypothetical protein n=1 Tax=Piscinibacter sp. TaxID=1903157 RepID=UPI002CB3D89C|nr:hypothetical protein [Albitalea sp.]HUG23566.1 hypothetical protein [Albitalea sp.]